jgi:hypothetical protein
MNKDQYPKVINQKKNLSFIQNLITLTLKDIICKLMFFLAKNMDNISYFLSQD